METASFPHILYCIYDFIISFIQSTGSGCFSAHDVSASTHLTSPGSSCSLSSVLFSPLLPAAPSMPYFSLRCLEFLFHGRKSFQHSQPFYWMFLSAIVLNGILALPRGSCCSCSLLFPAYLRLPFWLMTPSPLCKISSSFQVRADLLSTLLTALMYSFLGLPFVHILVDSYSSSPPTSLSPSVNSPLHFFLLPPLHLSALTSLQTQCRFHGLGQ